MTLLMKDPDAVLDYAIDWSAEYLARADQGKKTAEEEDRKTIAARRTGTRPSLPPAGYAGTYTDALYGDATVRAEENGRLVLRLARSPNLIADLQHWHYDIFEIRWRPTVAYNFPRGFVVFNIDKNGRTDKMEIDQPNNDFWFYELEFRRSK